MQVSEFGVLNGGRAMAFAGDFQIGQAAVGRCAQRGGEGDPVDLAAAEGHEVLVA